MVASQSRTPVEGTRAGFSHLQSNLPLALLLIVAIWLIAVSRWAWIGATVPWDSKNQFFAFFRFLAESLHAGTTVFWNPYHFGGHPSIADPQSLVFSPAFVLWAWFDRTPSMQTFDLLVMGHLLVGALAMAGLGQRRGWTTAAMVLAAAVFMFGAAASSRLNHTGIIICYGLFPLALLALEVALERRSVGAAVAFAVLAALIAVGRNQVALMLCVLLFVAFVARVWVAESPSRFLRERVGLILLVVFVTGALAAVPIVLTLQLAQLSNRPSMSLAAALEGSLHPTAFASMAVPDIFGSHTPGFGYWGPHYTILPEVGATDDTSNYLFIGASTTLLLLWIGLAAGRLWGRGTRALTIALVIAFLFAIGRYSPLFAIVFEHVPGFSFFRRPNDAVFIFGLLLALASGRLLTDFARDGTSGVPRWRLGATALGFAVLMGWAIAIASISGNGHRAVWEIARVAPVFVLAAVALYWPRNARHRSIAAAVLALVAVGELLVWNAASRMNAEASAYYRVLEQASTEDSEALRILNREMQRRRLEGSRPRVEIVGLDGPWQNLAIVRGFEATNGYNPLRIGIYDKFVSPGDAPSSVAERRFPPTFSEYDCALARAIGLEYVVLDRPIEQLRPVRHPDKIQALLAGPKVWIYRLHGAMPRVRFSSAIKVADVDATLINGELRDPPSNDHIVVDDETPPARKFSTSLRRYDTTTARITSWRPGRIEIDVDAADAGVLVLHDIYYPGWIAEIDGKRVPILRAEVLFRAVEVAAGKHTVVFRFAPLTFENLSRALQNAVGRL